MSDIKGVCVGIGDDMAVLEIGGETILLTCDMLLEGVHFVLGDCPAPANGGVPYSRATLEQVGYKAMACSLSDCAAMAALPWCAVVSVALPNRLGMTDAQQLHKGLQQAAQKFDCPIVGGDTTSWDKPLAINVSMLAKAAGITPVRRSGAQEEDIIFVTGTLGGSLAGRHLEFAPRVREARLLAERIELHALIDISDGLSRDLHHICSESGVGAVVDRSAIPLSPAARRRGDPLEAALADGEDFELLLCVSPADAETLQREWPRWIAERSQADASAARAGPWQDKLTAIGRIVPVKDSVTMFLRDEQRNLTPLAVKGWEHFT
ncbi:MAG: thiamine-monophosphate kinase [Sedimentisphaerales bacterium]|nr:thiamine-monophosphate kinase [Sedimentisphaerales bacterium]